MSDNIIIPASGTGDATPTVATDEIGGAHHQLVKMEFGVANSATQVSSSDPLPVTLGGTQAVSGSVTANAGTNLNTSALALESGGNLASVKSNTDKIPSLGQALAASSVPVVLTAAQVSTLTPPAAITGYATETTLGTTNTTIGTTNTEIGGLTETAPATDTASSGLNGRLQRIAQRITSLIALLPASLSNGFFQVSVKETITLPSSVADGSNVTLGAKADAKSTATDTTAITAMSVWKQISASVQAIASSVAGTLTVGTHAVTQSGTWNVGTVTTVTAVTAISNALPAGNSNIGDVDIASIAAGDNNIGNVDVVTLPSLDGTDIEGTVAHDSSAATIKPILGGLYAVAHGANPTGVTAADISRWLGNRAGVPFVIGGHPNVISTEYLWTTAQTDDAIVTISTGSVIVVTRISVSIDEACTVGVAFRVGFGSANLPTIATDGNAVAGVLLSHAGLVAGGGMTVGDGSGILGIGADGEDLRITTEAATGGAGRMYVSYYTVES